MRLIKWISVSLVSVSIVIFTLIFTAKQITISNINSTAQVLKESEHTCNYNLVQQGYKTIDPMLFASLTEQNIFSFYNKTIDLVKWEYHLDDNKNKKFRGSKFNFDDVDFSELKNKDGSYTSKHTKKHTKKFKLDNILCKENIHYAQARKSNSIVIHDSRITTATKFLNFTTIGFFPKVSIKINKLRSKDIDLLPSCKTASHQGDIKAFRALLLNHLSNCEIDSAINTLLEMKEKSSQEMLLLGDLNLTDSATGTRDTATANKWFLRAAARGTPKTQYHAAMRLTNDMPSTAKYILTLSAINGFELSAYQLSKISKDAAKSYFWSLNRYFLCLQENKICDEAKKGVSEYAKKIVPLIR